MFGMTSTNGVAIAGKLEEFLTSVPEGLERVFMGVSGSGRCAVEGVSVETATQPLYTDWPPGTIIVADGQAYLADTGSGGSGEGSNSHRYHHFTVLYPLTRYECAAIRFPTEWVIEALTYLEPFDLGFQTVKQFMERLPVCDKCQHKFGVGEHYYIENRRPTCDDCATPHIITPRQFIERWMVERYVYGDGSIMWYEPYSDEYHKPGRHKRVSPEEVQFSKEKLVVLIQSDEDWDKEIVWKGYKNKQPFFAVKQFIKGEIECL